MEQAQIREHNALTEHNAQWWNAAERAIDRCFEVSAISAMDGGIERIYLTPEHRKHNDLAAEWMRSAGLETFVDAAGTLHGVLASSMPDAPTLYLGSHLDTVPDAGKYDGILGVTLAIEVAEYLCGKDLPFNLEVLAFADEEGVRFGATLLGSSAMAGQWNPDWWDIEDENGITMRQAFVEFGLDPERIGEAAIDPAKTVGYLEAHIEQGPYLEADDQPLAVVTSIAGAQRLTFTVTGESRHAGGTPYEYRQDALVGASQMVLDIETIGREHEVIATVGELEVVDGAVNVVPGLVEFSLDLRAASDEARDSAFEAITESVRATASARKLTVSWELNHSASTAYCAPHLQRVIAQGVAAALPTQPAVESVPHMYSKAGHDAMAMEKAVDVGMLFLRCKGGISHNRHEDVRHDDVMAALAAFSRAVEALAK
ncbi:allantoate amidohydrolase [Rothia aerolata]|uniref:Zn-dependent hydrolase n=1 Tax=Rothia aerolata TaxID=1812262 RepID=A0A917IXH8_9MICC|nr:allantoate amidohydrolase [Rothia aerolata]GGH65832.1 Zn-dependent hydrolase [Rothia aerolata]